MGRTRITTIYYQAISCIGHSYNRGRGCDSEVLGRGYDVMFTGTDEHGQRYSARPKKRA